MNLLNRFAKLITIWLLEILELLYYFIALPILYPRKLVVFYYCIMLFFELGLFLACYYTIINVPNADDQTTLEILRNWMFRDLFIYWGVAMVSFFTGGMAVFLFVIDVQHYKSTLEADPYFLLDMLRENNITFIERVVRNGLCSFYDIVQKAILRMEEQHLDCTVKSDIDNFASKEPFIELLYFMIKEELIKLGPKEKLSEEKMKKPNWYKSYAIAALLHKCNGSLEKSNESELARRVILKLVSKRNFKEGRRRLIPYHHVRRAGASLTFLRYHLKVDESLFCKNAELNCTAEELYNEHFDLLFCLRAHFGIDELIDAGFNKELCEYFKNYSLSSETQDLQKLKEKGFKRRFFMMRFRVSKLKEFGLFSREHLFKYYVDYRKWLKGSSSYESDKSSSTIEVEPKNTIRQTVAIKSCAKQSSFQLWFNRYSKSEDIPTTDTSGVLTPVSPSLTKIFEPTQPYDDKILSNLKKPHKNAEKSAIVQLTGLRENLDLDHGLDGSSSKSVNYFSED
jgi:hypothetical protein